MKHYYAIFRKKKKNIEVNFPDLPGCLTFASTWEEAIENAEDALAAWLAHAEPAFIASPSKRHQLEHLSGDIIPVAVNENIQASYQKLKRFNVIFPEKILKRIDGFRKKAGLKRSTFLQQAAEAYLDNVTAISKLKSRG